MTTELDPTAVTLRGDELPWQPVSPALRTVRLITLFAFLTPVVVVFGVLAIVLSPWFWIGAVVAGVVLAWGAWLIFRQVSAISWIELPDEIVIRKGRLFRSLVSIPYGRLQYIDVQSGPLMRSRGIASCEFHTASPQSGGTLPGLPLAEAEALRGRLAAHGEAQRAGL
ncbi:membrane protein [Knoellia sinensis KCTC 19936]|uniref:Membrane protein n=1 Tax=Knoellia sinensis KCTC 19936 TaxID=1385520 RepID=A0A0A0JBQ0_9MICO|nr:PH domain-containing protein [Knoellia sinensis]KGN34578.1 membrane protein [Knoellia sinensis KCTC 19936]